jgi:hypothetical protein
MTDRTRSAAVLRTSLAAALIALGLVCAVMEVQAELLPRNTRRPAVRAQFASRAGAGRA